MEEKNDFIALEEKENGVSRLALKGYLDAHTAPNLEDALQELIERGKYKILINLGELDYISSAGLGVFMAFIEEARENGGDIKISELKPKVLSVFELLGFPALFDIFERDEEALDRFRKGKMKRNE